jgi:hypothetical protein
MADLLLFLGRIPREDRCDNGRLALGQAIAQAVTRKPLPQGCDGRPRDAAGLLEVTLVDEEIAEGLAEQALCGWRAAGRELAQGWPQALEDQARWKAALARQTRTFHGNREPCCLFRWQRGEEVPEFVLAGG